MPSRPSECLAARASARSRAENSPFLFEKILGGRKEKRSVRRIFCEAGRRFAAAGGGSVKIPLFGFVYQIW